MAKQIRVFGARMSKTQSMHYYGGARCRVTQYTNGAGKRRFVASGGWAEWDRSGSTRRTARAAWRAARRGDGK